MTDTNPLHTFAPHDLAGMFDVSVMTIRRWAEYHADHLSTGANPAPGQVRRFSWSDVETMRNIKAWRDNGLSVEAINVKLTEATAQSNTAVTIPVSLTPDTNALDAQHSTPALTVALFDLERRIDAKLEAIQRSREPSYFVGIGIGFIAALLFVLVVVGLAVLYGGFR